MMSTEQVNSQLGYHPQQHLTTQQLSFENNPIQLNNNTDINNATNYYLQNKNKWIHFYGGLISQTIATTITQPFDVLRVRLQSENFKRYFPSFSSATTATGKTTIENMSSFQMLKQFHKAEGTIGLFRGWSANLIAMLPTRSIYFSIYENLKQYPNKYYINIKRNYPDWVFHSSCAAISCWTCCTLMNPIFVVKTRKQLMTVNNDLNYFNVIKRIYLQDGFKGFYKGLFTAYFTIIDMAIYFGLYEAFKKNIILNSNHQQEPYLDNNNNNLNNISNSKIIFHTLWISIFCKLISQSITYPQEVIKTRLREEADLNNNNNNKRNKINVRQIIKEGFKRDGWKSFYRGWNAHLLRVLPSNAILFVTYEMFLKQFH